MDGNGVVEQSELDALGLCVLDLFLTGGELILAAAVSDVNMLSAQTLGNARCVHCDVACTDNADVVEMLNRRIVIIAVSLHEVYAGEKLVCGVNAEQVLAGDVQELGQTCAGADEHCLKAVLEQLVDGLGLADDGVVYDLDAHCLEVIDLGSNDLLRKTELRNTVNKNTAGLVESLEDGDVIAHLAQIARAGEGSRAGADDRDTVTVGLGSLDLILDFLVHVVVGNKTLEAADADALALDAAHALALALLFLGADTAADCGQRVGGGDDLICCVKVALCDLGDEFGDAYRNGAAGAAGHIVAVEAALCLVHCHLGSVAESDLVKVAGADYGILLGHRVFIHSHISHYAYLRSYCRYALQLRPAPLCRKRHALSESRSRPRARQSPDRQRRQTWSRRRR